MNRALSLFGLLLLAGAASSQGQSLEGVIDLHAHCGPDRIARSVDALELARLAQSKGMRGVVLKSHYEPTGSLAYVVRKAVPGIEVFGGVGLNLAMGGINPAAVDQMVRLTGGYGRVVWMPTFDAENQVKTSGEKRPFVSIASHGELLPAVREVLSLIARHHLILATGHSSPEESLLLIREARRAGVNRIIVTHPLLSPVNMPVEQMREAAKMGAYLELVYNGIAGAAAPVRIEEVVRAIRAAGPASCVLASDLGQVNNPPHPDGLLAFFGALRKQGVTEAEIHQMAKTNPARLLGLE